MMVNEKIDEPMMTARARVQSTCRVMAVAPETAKAKRTARRALDVTTGPPVSAGCAWAASSSRLGPAGAVGQRRLNRWAIRMAAARDRSKLAARKLDLRTPMSGREMNPARKEPLTPPKMFTAYSVPRRRLTRPNSKGRDTK